MKSESKPDLTLFKMINNIYFDLDECLIHTEHAPFDEATHYFFTESFGNLHLALHPAANSVISYARDLVGKDNVYILTTSVKEYAAEINSTCCLGFDEDHIFSREDLNARGIEVPTCYDSFRDTLPHETAHIDNVIIDNLEPRENKSKISFIGIDMSYKTNYLKVRGYWGVNFPNDPFETKVKEFLNES